MQSPWGLHTHYSWTVEIGSIEAGKRADFAVLEDDPTTIDPTRLNDVKVWGTVQDGRVFDAKDI